MDRKEVPVLKNKNGSIKRYLFIGGIGGSVLLLLLLMCFGGYIILQYRHVYKRDHAAMTSDYAQQLARDIGSMEAYVKKSVWEQCTLSDAEKAADYGKPVDARCLLPE